MRDHGGGQVPKPAGKAASRMPGRAGALAPGQIQRPENQKSQWHSSHRRASGLETQNDSVFLFESEGRKKKASVLVWKQSGRTEFSLTQERVSLFALFRPSADLRAVCFSQCWRRPSRMWLPLTCELTPGNRSPPTPSPVLGMSFPPSELSQGYKLERVKCCCITEHVTEWVKASV